MAETLVTDPVVAAATETPAIAVWGAIGLGFVLGWTLYFANRGKSGNISATELAAIAAVVFGSAITGFFEQRSELLGGYGIGLFLGFATLFVLTALALRRQGEGILPALERGIAPPDGPRPLGSVSGGRGALERATPESANEIRAALEALRDRLMPLILKVGTARDAAEGEDRTALSELLRGLVDLRRQVHLTLALAAFTSPELKALNATIDTETKNLNDEAARLRRATNAANEISSLLDSLTNASISIRKLLGS